ncbi:aminotransferase class IV [Flagellimonas nanhaiensis]|uniref:Aminotransferase IV n=1 Tax=Flagellimonas nanhaiensis TaxID=2292706 RepID=A0A371JQB7_9FLAO|nr:aminotransferase class IV [Allomuricauda nanhaiensis]RDY59704.1 aminotransferase IV [Allomuricauda nanhaiensis]
MHDYPQKVYLNGEILNHEDAKISVFDRGFLFGDGVYEVMLQINGSFFYGDEHLARLSKSLLAIHLEFDLASLPDKIETLLKASDLHEKDSLVYIQITRGVAPRKHAFPEKAMPTLMMYAKPFEIPDINQKQASVRIMDDFRWHRCDIKSVSLLANVMANTEITKEGDYEVIFSREGAITEGSHSNIFFVKNNVVYTHPANEHILDGITRQIAIELCKDIGVEVREEAISKKEIANMDEAFLTGTTTQIASVKQIDDHLYYTNDDVGQITKRLQEALSQLK